MNIGKYVASLLPSFEKSRIEEDIRIQREELSENTIPPYASAAEWFEVDGFSSRENKDYDKLFTRSVEVDRKIRGNYITVVHGALERALESVQMIEEGLDKHFGRDVAAGGMTYTRANILRYLEVVSFGTRYARKLLLWTLHNEKSAAGRRIGDPFTKAEEKWLQENRRAFFQAVRVMAHQAKDIRAILTNIPDMVVVPEEIEIAKETVGLAKIDPLKMNLIPTWANPVYHVRMAVAEWQVARYKAAQEEKRMLEYRLLALKELREGKEDAKLEQQIEYTENRVKKLNHRMAKLGEE